MGTLVAMSCPSSCRLRRGVGRRYVRRSDGLAERAAAAASGADGSTESSADAIKLDRAAMVGHRQGRRGWMREAVVSLMSTAASRPSRSRAPRRRLLEAERRMQEDLAVELATSEGYDAWRAEGVAAGVAGHRGHCKLPLSTVANPVRNRARQPRHASTALSDSHRARRDSARVTANAPR
jgi:hypothetical protein